MSKKYNGYELPNEILPHVANNHPDEIFASIVAQKSIFNATGVLVPINRLHFSKITEDVFNDPKKWVIDQGGRYDPNLGNFDHHQDPKLPAANMLVLTHLTKMGLMTIDFAQFLEHELFSYLDLVDRGKIVEGMHHNYPTVNYLYRTIGDVDNYDKTWSLLLEITDAVLEGLLVKFNKLQSSEYRWGKLVHEQGYSYDPSTSGETGCPSWAIFAKKSGTDFFIWYKEKYGKWAMVTLDSRKKPIENLNKNKTGGQTYVSLESGWIASYDTLAQAREHAESMVKRHKSGEIIIKADIDKVVKGETLFLIHEKFYFIKEVKYLGELNKIHYGVTKEGTPIVIDWDAYWSMESAVFKIKELHNNI